MLIDLPLSVAVISSQVNYTHVVNLHLAQGTRPAVETKHLICKSYGLVPLQVRNSAATIARSLRYVFGTELFV